MKSLLRWTAASLAAVFLVSASSQNAFSQAIWNGTTSGVWSDGTNWTPGAPNGTTDGLLFTGNTNTTTTNDLVGATIGSFNWNSTVLGGINVAVINGANATTLPALNAAILFLNGNTTSNAPTNTFGNFTLNGNKIILGGNIVSTARPHSGTPTNNQVFRDVINLDMDLNGTRTITTDLNGTNNQTQTQHSLVINGALGETGAGLGNITKNGAGVLVLNPSANTMTGALTVTAGTVQFTNPAAFGAQPIRSSNGSVQYNGVGNVTMGSEIRLYNTNNQGITLLADGVGGANSTLTYNGTFSSTAGTQIKTLTLSGANTALNTFASNITDGAAVRTGVTKAGNGRWVVGPDNTYSGLTTLNAGTLNVSNLQDDLSLPSSVGRNTTINSSNGQLRYAASTLGPQVIANRTINLPGTNNQGITILNDSANDASNNTLVFNGGFTIPNGTQAKTLTLSGSQTGNNVWNAVIPNGPAAATNLTKAGAGQWVVTSNNTFSGTANANAGTLTVLSIDDTIATPQPLGVSGNTTFNGGTLNYAGTTPLSISSNRTFSMIGSGQFNNGAAAGNTVIFNGNLNVVPGTAENNNTRTWTLGGGNTGANKFNSLIADSSFTNGNGTFRRPITLNKLNGGLWEVTGNNTYSGQTIVQQGTLVASTIGDKGVAGNLGTGNEVGMAGGNIVGNATIRLGTANNTGVLRYIGTGESSNRLFQIGAGTAANNNGGGQIINQGSGALVLTGEGGFFNSNDIGANSTAQRVLTLGGNNTGVNQITAIIRDNTLAVNTTGTANVGLTKANGNTWALSGANTYSGTTNVNGGTLLINGNQSGATGNVTVAAAGTLGGSGTVGGAATISGKLSPGNSPGVLTFAAGVSLLANSTFDWELSSSTVAGRGTAFDGIDITGGALAIDGAAISNLRFNQLGSTVNFTDAFWSANHSWLVGDVAANNYAGPLFGTINQTPDAFANASPIGVFSWGTAGGDVVLNYTAIPEPSSILLTVLGLAGAGLRRSRKRRE